MATFKSIIRNVMNIDETQSFLSPYYLSPNDNISWLFKILFSNFLMQKLTIQCKFKLFFDILNGPFVYRQQKEFAYDFYKIQKTYYAFNKIALIYKYNKH